MSTTQLRPWTVDEFLAWENHLDERFEYLPGHMVVAMVGGSRAHYVAVANVVGQLLSVLPERCRVVSQGMKLRIDAADSVLYPDVMVVYGDADASPADTEETRADLIVEVLSPSTAEHDRGRKWEAYRRVDGLAAYILLDPIELTAFTYTRAGSSWTFTAYDAGAEIPLTLPDDHDIRLELSRVWFRPPS